jgi:hypothetical protein
VIIFRLFPDSKIAVSGPFQQLSINASGAFGAYVATVAMGYFLVQSIQESIIVSEGVTEWNIVAPLRHDDPGGATVPVRAQINSVVFDPDLKPFRSGAGSLYLNVYRSQGGAWPVVLISAEGFQAATLDLEKMALDKQYRTQGTRRLVLTAPLVLKEVPRAFKQSAYDETEPLVPTDATR